MAGSKSFQPKSISGGLALISNPAFDLTLTYNILSGHILATIMIWIAATHYYLSLGL